MMPYHRFTPPVIGDFTWVNQGTATVTDRKGMAVLETPSVASGENLRLLVKSAPATPYEITVAMMAFGPIYTTSNAIPQFGFCCRESSFGQAAHLRLRLQQLPPPLPVRPVQQSHVAEQLASWTHRRSRTGRSGCVFPTTAPTGGSTSLGMGSSSTSPWAKSPGRTFLTADEIGVFANSWKSSYVPRVISFLHWREA